MSKQIAEPSAGTRAWIVFAVLASCAGGQTPAPAAVPTARAVGVEVTASVTGTLVELTARRVMACAEAGASKCAPMPMANTQLALFDHDSDVELATVRAGQDGTARLDLMSVDEKVVQLGDSYDVMMGDQRKATVDIHEARALVVAAKNERDGARYYADAQAATERKDWQAAALAANRCVRSVPNHVECAHLADQAAAALRDKEDSYKQKTADDLLALATVALTNHRWQDAFALATGCLKADPLRAKCTDVLAKTKGHIQAAPAQPSTPAQFEFEPARQRTVQVAREHGYERVIFDVGITGAVNLMVVGRNKLADFEGAVIEAHQVDSALRPIQLLGKGEALFTSSIAELPVLIVDFPREITEHSEFNLLGCTLWKIKGVTEYQTLRRRQQAVIIAPAW
jgi:hypothetical protein